MFVEQELKLQVLTDDSINIKDNPWVALCHSEPPRTVHMVSTYYDTPDLQLFKQRIGLRMRKVGDQWLQTVKTRGSAAAGLHQRNEWEDNLVGPEWDLDALRQTPVAPLIDDDATWCRIEPVFVTDFYRLIYLLTTEDDDLVELAHDRGVVRARWCGETKRFQAEEPINEIELELKAGRLPVLFQIGSSLCHTFPLHYANRSKAERGYRLMGKYSPASPVKASKFKLSRKMTAEQSLQRILQTCLQQLQLNEQALLENAEDPEAVHQMRVATRKIRACLAILGNVVGKAAVRECNHNIKWITDQLGPARDWDVFVLETLQPMSASFAQTVEWQQLLKGAEEQQRQAYKHAIQSMCSAEYSRRLLDFSGWVEGCGWQSGLSAKRKKQLAESLPLFSDRQIEAQYQVVMSAGCDITALSVERRHELRIDCKKLRYTVEFFQEVYSRKTTKGFVGLLSQLQDCLGKLNDVSVASGLLDQLNLAEHDPGRWLVLGWCGARAQTHDDDLGNMWKNIQRYEPFWRGEWIR